MVRALEERWKFSGNATGEKGCKWTSCDGSWTWIYLCECSPREPLKKTVLTTIRNKMTHFVNITYFLCHPGHSLINDSKNAAMGQTMYGHDDINFLPQGQPYYHYWLYYYCWNPLWQLSIQVFSNSTSLDTPL